MNTFEGLRWRFPRVSEVVCMATHSFAPLPAETFDDLAAYAQTLRQRPKPPADWFARLEEAYGLFEQLLGAAPGSVGLCASSTACIAAILAAIEPRPDRRRILVSDLQFPSMDYLCEAQARRVRRPTRLRRRQAGELGIGRRQHDDVARALPEVDRLARVLRSGRARVQQVHGFFTPDRLAEVACAIGAPAAI